MENNTNNTVMDIEERFNEQDYIDDRLDLEAFEKLEEQDLDREEAKENCEYFIKILEQQEANAENK